MPKDEARKQGEGRVSGSRSEFKSVRGGDFEIVENPLPVTGKDDFEREENSRSTRRIGFGGEDFRRKVDKIPVVEQED